MSESQDYHDYVFQDGKLVGKFEEMYRNSSITPWHQDEQASWIDVRLTKEIVVDIPGFDRVFDFGSGTGHYLNLICNLLLLPTGSGHGFDISQTACDQASQTFGNFSFSVLDITEPLKKGQEPSVLQKKQNTRDLLVMRGTLWYIVQDIEIVLNNFSQILSEKDHLLIVQNFPPHDSEFYGKQIIPNPGSLLELMGRNFKLDRSFWYQDASKTTNDNWFCGLFSKRN